MTGLAVLVLAASAIGAGVLLAHRFGSTARTDGFLLAYGVYIVLIVAAQSFRLVVVPALTRADEAGLLGSELRAYALAFLALAVPVSALVGVLSGPTGDLIAGRLPHEAAVEAAQALVWLVPAAFLQLLAALAASGLAARGSYGTAAAGYALGGVAGLVVFAALSSGHGLIALAWGLVLNGLIATAVPFGRLVLMGVRPERPLAGIELHRRLWLLLQGAAIPVVAQGLYLVALRLASKLGVGDVSTFSYAYFFAATLVTATAFSLGLISSAPLTRRGIDASAAAGHVVNAVWVSLFLVGAAIGVFALVGDRIVEAVLGSQYEGVGRLVLSLAPWMVVSSALQVTLPLVFVFDRRRWLVALALVALGVDLPLALAFRAEWGSVGIAVALAVVTLLLVVGLMVRISTRMVEPALLGLARLTLVVGAVAAAAFVLPALVLPRAEAAVAGILLYGAAMVGLSLRSDALRDAWAYVRALH